VKNTCAGFAATALSLKLVREGGCHKENALRIAEDAENATLF
jgi:hypothetical protein